MRVKKTLIVGCLTLGLAFTGSLSLADSHEKQNQDEPRSEPKINDYSSMGEEYGSDSTTTTTEDTDSASASRVAPPEVTREGLITGYEKYNGNCAQCHGEDAVGSSFAPSLVTRMKNLDYAGFVDAVTNGKTVFDSSTGGYNVMPPWKGNAAVMSSIDEIWGYVKARAEGELGPGRPK